MKVVNVRGMPANKEGVVYCGRDWAGWRDTGLGNPFGVKVYGKDAVPNYHSLLGAIVMGRELFTYRPSHGLAYHARVKQFVNPGRVLDALLSLQEDDTLGCWCCDEDNPRDVPCGREKCHAVVIAKAFRYLRDQNESACCLSVAAKEKSDK